MLVPSKPIDIRVATFRHLMFFEYLAISPSYNLAHQFRLKKTKIDPANIPRDFEKVLEIYDMVGDVTDIPFKQWWVKGGQDLFIKDKLKKNIIFKVNPNKSNNQIKKDFSKYLELVNNATYQPKNPKIQLLKNKVRNVTLNDRLTIVRSVCNLSSNNITKPVNPSSNLPYWKIALKLKFSFSPLLFFKHNKHLNQILIDEKKGRSNKKKKAYITMLMSKFIREALNISENAARGKFPSTSNSKYFLKFDFESLSRVLSIRNAIRENDVMSNIEESTSFRVEPYKFNSFYHRLERYKLSEFRKKYAALLKKYSVNLYKQLNRQDEKVDLSELKKINKRLRKAKSHYASPPDFLDID